MKIVSFIEICALLIITIVSLAYGTSLRSEIDKILSDTIQRIKYPFQDAYIGTGSIECANIKKLLGLTYAKIAEKKEPDFEKMSIVYIAPGTKKVYNISSAGTDIPKDFTSKQKFYIYINGYTESPYNYSYQNISTALFSVGKRNVLALDVNDLIQNNYFRSSTYAKFLGEKLGEVLADMVDNGIDPLDIHLIGHSLGAHIAGEAGKMFTSLKGVHLGRITGLDPAGPCYDQLGNEYKLDATDAGYVDVIHTDTDVFGYNGNAGHADYYPNKGQKQKGCISATCSHNRAWQFFKESILNETAFPAVKCDSWKDFKAGKCDYNDISYMGFASSGASGQYYLVTNAETPFGRGQAGIHYD